MLYRKPDNLRYVDMCIYIDNHIYDTDNPEIQNTVYIYVYHIFYMLAKKKKLFKSENEYDDFAIFGAGRIYKRYTNPKWKTKQGLQIKSILNYIKSIFNFIIIDFQQETYSQVLSPPAAEEEYSVGFRFSDLLSNSIDGLSVVEFDNCLSNICKTVKQYLKRIPYSGIVWHNIYLSCLLTILNSITLSNPQITWFSALTADAYKDKQLESMYKQCCEEILLYHLDDSYYDYIKILVREVKHIIAKDLSLTIHTYIPTDTGFHQAMIEDLQSSAFDDCYKDD